MTDDLISRQAVDKIINDLLENDYLQASPSVWHGLHMIKQLPSAVVRCKECRWWDKKDDSPYGYCHAMKHAYYSRHWEIGIYRTYKDDWFCADGERKDGDPDA